MLFAAYRFPQIESIVSEGATHRSIQWIVREGGHTQALKTYPDEYEERIIGFLNDKTILTGK